MALPDRDSAAPGETRDASRRSAVTFRAVAGGVLLAVVAALWNTFVEYIAHGSRLNITHFPVALFSPFLVLTLGNALLRRAGARWALHKAEVMAMLALGFLGAAIPAYGLTSYFLGMISVPYYRASPENQWGTHFHSYLPTWLIPSNEGDAMRWLFEGLPTPDMPIPWGVWTVPLLGWTTVIAALLLGSFCLSVIVRKQWADYERLAYPILHPAAELAESGEAKSVLSSGLLWAGAAIPLGVILFNMVGYFTPGWPTIRLGPDWMSMGSFFPRIHVRFNFYTVGFAYFANVDVLFSIWVFYLFYCIQIAIFRRVGINLSNKSDSGDATTSLQAGGAFVAMVLWGLWIARGHLRDVFVKAFRPDHPADDSQELVSYRFAVFGFLFSLVFLVLWLHAIGIDWDVAMVLGAGTFLLYLGGARVIAETGIVYFSIPMAPDGVLPYLFGGPNAFNPATQTALRVFGSLRSQYKGMFLPPLVHGVRIADGIQAHRRRLVPGFAVTLGVGIAVTIAFTLYLGYTKGAYNFNDLPFASYPISTYDDLVKALKGEVTWEENRFVFFLLGAAVFGLCSLMRYRLTWWPLAPIGMVVPPTHAVHSMFSVFCAWGIKAVILKVGGVNLYRRLRPLFLGLLVGHGLGVLVSFLVDQVWFPGHGHHVHSW